MFEKFIPLSLILAVTVFLLVACQQANAAPTPQSTPTLWRATATLPRIPLTPTLMPEPGIFSYEQALPLFNYDASAPFDLYVSSEKEQNGVVIQEIAYLAADPTYIPQTTGKIVAYLVKPSKSGSYAGILYLHGLGQGWGNRKEFLEEAVGLARQGVVSLLPMGIFPWFFKPSGNGAADQIKIIKQVIELRRSVDFLLAQPDVDPKRIAFVGHDYGAMHGALLSGIEKRIKAYVLMAGDANYSDWTITYLTKPADEKTYRKSMVAVDPISYLPHAAPAALLLQFGGGDGFVPKASADQSFDAASEPKKLGWYASAGHTLNEQASQDRLAWLELQLGLKSAP